MDDWIGIILPTKDGKYVIARAIIKENRKIETLDDCAIKVSDVDNVKSDLKYPVVLLMDIETLRQKLIEDWKKFINNMGHIDLINKTTVDTCFEAFKLEINKRFGVE